MRKLWYINRKVGRTIETVDEFECPHEANKMMHEYRIADRIGDYYISMNPTKAWREKE